MRKGQIKIIGEGNPSNDVTLYCRDGEPMFVLPAINMAYERFKTRYNPGNRPGIVASFLCEESPENFEPRAGHDLSSDVDCLYRLYTKNEKAWELEILKRSKAPGSKLETTVERTQFAKLVSPMVKNNAKLPHNTLMGYDYYPHL